MLNMGQFEHTLNELLSWLGHTEQTLNDLPPVKGDVRTIDIELAKHKVQSLLKFSCVWYTTIPSG